MNSVVNTFVHQNTAIKTDRRTDTHTLDMADDKACTYNIKLMIVLSSDRLDRTFSFSTD